MKRASVNGVELEYEVMGSGEPVLLVSPVLADGFLPLLSAPGLADRYRLIHYRRRGWGGSTHTPPPVSIADHARDAAALLDHLELAPAHLVGHSSGGSIALQLALDRPTMVHSLVLLEPSFFTLPAAEPFVRRAGSALDAYAAGDLAGALAIFLSAASGREWESCRAVLERRIPGAVAAALADADTLFGIELPAVAGWSFDARTAAEIRQPALSVVGGTTEPLWMEIDELLRSSLPRVEGCRVEGAGHLLHMLECSEPLARAIGHFLARHPLGAGRRRPSPPASVAGR